MHYSFRNNDYVKAYYTINDSRILLGNEVDSSLYSDAKLNLFGLGYYAEHLDYNLNPRKGILFESGIANGNRESKDEKTNFTEFSANVDAYIPLYKGLVLKLSSKNRYAFSEGVQYLNELYRIGGFNSLRGFSEERFSVSKYSVLSSDLRYLYERNSNAFLFYEAAGLRSEIGANKGVKYTHSFGLGTNLSTRAGIFTISYGIGSFIGEPFKLSESQVHIGYSNRF
jgi:outer membrane protein assembly factor BamA